MSENATPETASTPPAAPNDELALVYELPVTVHVEFGEASLTIGDLLKCGKGSVIKLNQKIGDPFRITLLKRPIAEGEVVEAGEFLGIKITNVFKTPNPTEGSSS